MIVYFHWIDEAIKEVPMECLVKKKEKKRWLHTVCNNVKNG